VQPDLPGGQEQTAPGVPGGILPAPASQSSPFSTIPSPQMPKTQVPLRQMPLKQSKSLLQPLDREKPDDEEELLELLTQVWVHCGSVSVHTGLGAQVFEPSIVTQQ